MELLGHPKNKAMFDKFALRLIGLPFDPTND
jgi:hypothetical protein